MGKVTEYPTIITPNNSDILFIDGQQGPRNITYKSFKDDVVKSLPIAEIPPLTTSLEIMEEGIYALDGAVGKLLNDKINAINAYIQKCVDYGYLPDPKIQILQIYNNGKLVLGGSWAGSGEAQNYKINDSNIELSTQVGYTSSTVYTTDSIDLSSINTIYIKKECVAAGSVYKFNFEIGSSMNSNDLFSIPISDGISETNVIDISSISNRSTCYLRFYIEVSPGNAAIYRIYDIKGINE